MTDIHRIHIPCPACGFCNHIYSGENLPKGDEPPKPDLEVEIFNPPLDDMHLLIDNQVSCANCNSTIKINIEFMVYLAVVESETEATQNAPTTGTVQ